MGDSDPDEGDRSRKSRDTGGQEGGKKDQAEPEARDIDPHRGCARLSKKVCADGFGEEEGEEEGDGDDRHEEARVGHCGPGEASERPAVQVHDVRVVCKGDDKVCDS